MATSSNTTQRNIALGLDITKLVEGFSEAGTAAGNFHKTLVRVSATLLAFKVANTAINALKSIADETIRAGAVFERADIQLRVFIGDSERAAKTMEFLTFQSTRLAGGIEDLIAGSTALETFGLDTQRWLELVADTAQATGRQVEDVAIAFGRIAIGDPRTKQFLTTRRGDLLEFNRVLEETGSRLMALEAAFGRFRGVSAELEGSFYRLTENLGDFLFIAAKIAGEPIFESVKSTLKGITDILKDELFVPETERLKENTIFHVISLAIRNTMNDLEALGEIVSAIGNPFQLFTKSGQPEQRESDATTAMVQRYALFFRDFLGGFSMEHPRGDTWFNRTFGLTPEREAFLRGQGEKAATIFVRGIDTGLTGEQIDRFRDAVGRVFVPDRGSDTFNAIFDDKDIKDAYENAIAWISDKKGGWNAGKMWREWFFEGVKRAQTPEEAKALEELLRYMEFNIRRINQKELSNLPIFERGRKMVRGTKAYEDSEAEKMEIERTVNVYEAEITSDLNAYNYRVELLDSYAKLEQDFVDRFKKGQSDALKDIAQERRELLNSQISEATGLYNRYIRFDIFSLFGGNEQIDRQVKSLKEELDIMNGMAEPLTRQAALQQRILELESQRIGVIDRLSGTFRQLANDIANAAAKAALLNLMFGSSGGGFMSLFRTALGVGSLFAPGGAGVKAGLSAINFASGGFSPDFGSGIGIRPGSMGVSPKPAINAIFIGQDAVPMIERAETLAGRRATYA